jgi:hypothetical protein
MRPKALGGSGYAVRRCGTHQPHAGHRGVSQRYRDVLDYELGTRIVVEFTTRRRQVVDYVVILTVDYSNDEAAVRVYDGSHGINDLHRHGAVSGKAPAENFHAGTLGEGLAKAWRRLGEGLAKAWRRDASCDHGSSRWLQGDDRSMASNVNPAESSTSKAMDRAIGLAIEGDTPYPKNVAFVKADSPHAGSEMERALDDGYAVVLVSGDGRERIITAKTLAA